MQKYKVITFILILLTITSPKVKANDIQVSTFNELINSHPISGDTIEFLDNLTSDSTIGYNFYGLNISFEGQNYSVNGNNTFGGFVLNQDSLFNQIKMINCKGQVYNNSNFAGAVYNSGGEMNVNNSTFSGNFADSGGINYGVGGALYNLNGGYININNTLFENNYANGASSYGGAIANGYQAGTAADMSISNSIFKNNHAEGSVIPYGGALYNNGELSITKTLFDGNFAQGERGSYVSGGALYNEGSTTISQSKFFDNKSIGLDYSSVTGGGIYNTKDLTIIDTTFTNNSGSATDNSIVVGGGVYNTGNVNLQNADFSFNIAEGGNNTNVLGGALYNNNSFQISNSQINSNSIIAGNSSDAAGGAIYNIGTGVIENCILSNNLAKGGTTNTKGGAIYNNSSLQIISSTISENTAESSSTAEGGAIYNNTNGIITVKNSTLSENKVSTTAQSGEGGAIYNAGIINLENTTLTENYDRNGELNDIYNADGTINFTGSETNNILSGISGTGIINKTNDGILNLGGINNNYKGNFNFESGTLNLLKNSSYFSAQNSVFGNDVNFNMQNGNINNINYGNLTLNGQTNLFVDANLSTQIMDTINANSFNGNGIFYVKNIATEGIPEQQKIIIPFADSTLKDHVSYTPTTLETPIYDYNVSYNSSNGDFEFIRGGFSSAILTSEVATQLGGYLVQLETYKNIFANLDMVMITPPNKLKSFAFQNKMAASIGQVAFSPLLIPEENKGIWIKPYTTFEKVQLKNGPNVSNVIYGTLLGGESDLKKLKRNWYGLYGAYVSYNGSHQAYQGNSIYSNGGFLGLDAALYKGNFFSAWTINVGANAAEASTIFGQDNFSMLNAGVAQKSGYNWELANNKIIIQPNIMTSYTFINTFSYTTSSNVDINTQPLHALHIEPGIKIIGNFKNYFQPYLSVSVAWNLIDHAKFKANDIYLSDLSIKPYIQYGVGIQKRWGERFTGFIESMIRNGGRNGIALMFGIRISI